MRAVACAEVRSDCPVLSGMEVAKQCGHSASEQPDHNRTWAVCASRGRCGCSPLSKGHSAIPEGLHLRPMWAALRGARAYL
eukprot:221555-Amphidinium_carterae.2